MYLETKGSAPCILAPVPFVGSKVMTLREVRFRVSGSGQVGRYFTKHDGTSNRLNYKRL